MEEALKWAGPPKIALHLEINVLCVTHFSVTCVCNVALGRLVEDQFQGPGFHQLIRKKSRRSPPAWFLLQPAPTEPASPSENKQKQKSDRVRRRLSRKTADELALLHI